MMTLLVFAAIVLVAWWLLTQRRPVPDTESWRPARLRSATLAYAERTFRSPAERLVARIDRAYQLQGELTLVEFKTRKAATAHRSDVVELSVQRIALEDETGERVSDQAYVVVQRITDGYRSAVPVTLLARADVQRLRARRIAILRGEASPCPARNEALCKSCGHYDRCSATFGDR